MEKIVFHIDVNSAFLSWEAVYRLHHRGEREDLRAIPSAVGGDITMRHGIILAKSIPAKKYGIKTGETILEARRKCPALKLVPPNYALYEKSSEALMDLLKEYTPQVEQYSVDEAFADMTQSCALYGNPVETADRIRERIKRELGFTVNIGVSENKLLAKMASDFQKPDRVHTLYRREIKQKMWPLPVSDLFFVGRATAEKLFSLGIRTIGQLAAADPGVLKQHLKKQGELIWGFANGMDVSAVLPEPPENKGYGNSTTIAFDVTDAGTARRVLLSLSETVGARLRRDGAKARVVAVGIKDWNLHYTSHQETLNNATNITKEIYEASCRLFDEKWDRTPVRHLGIHTGGIQRQAFARQLDLFAGQDYEKLEKADRMADEIRKRFGAGSIKRAVFLEGPIRHMSGGNAGNGV